MDIALNQSDILNSPNSSAITQSIQDTSLNMDLSAVIDSDIATVLESITNKTQLHPNSVKLNDKILEQVAISSSPITVVENLIPRPPTAPRPSDTSRPNRIPHPPKTPSSKANVYRRKHCFTSPAHSQTHPARLETPQKREKRGLSNKTMAIKIAQRGKDFIQKQSNKENVNQVRATKMSYCDAKQSNSQVYNDEAFSSNNFLHLTSNVKRSNNKMANSKSYNTRTLRNLELLRQLNDCGILQPINPNKIDSTNSSNAAAQLNRIKLTRLKKQGRSVGGLENLLYTPFELEIKEKQVLVSKEKELKETTGQLVQHLKSQIEKQLEVIELQNDQLNEQEEEIRCLRARKKGVNLDALSKSF